MTASDLLKSFEGCRLTAYQDQGGIWTVGYGCTGADIGPGTVWTQERADAELLLRVNKLQDIILHALQVHVTPQQLAALVSLAYNIGPGAFLRSTVLRELNSKDFKAAADAFLLWNRVRGKVNEGLARRREAERAVFLTP